MRESEKVVGRWMRGTVTMPNGDTRAALKHPSTGRVYANRGIYAEWTGAEFGKKTSATFVEAERGSEQAWAVICFDEFGLTVEGTSPDPETVADKFAAAAGQEFTMWPGLEPSIYMLIEPEDLPSARVQEQEES